MNCYASYMRPEEDIALSGLRNAGLNELVEVGLGGTLALFAAVCLLVHRTFHAMSPGSDEP